MKLRAHTRTIRDGAIAGATIQVCAAAAVVVDAEVVHRAGRSALAATEREARCVVLQRHLRAVTSNQGRVPTTGGGRRVFTVVLCIVV